MADPRMTKDPAVLALVAMVDGFIERGEVKIVAVGSPRHQEEVARLFGLPPPKAAPEATSLPWPWSDGVPVNP